MSQLPLQFYKPVVKRPSLHVFGQNKNVIRGISKRCIFCSGLLDIHEEFCHHCNSTQIDMNASMNGKSVKDAPIWKKRYDLMGNPKGGYSP